MKDESNRRIGSHSARSGRDRDTTAITGSVMADTSRLSAVGQCGRRTARRVSGFTTQGSTCADGQRRLSSIRRDSPGGPECHDRAAVAIPGPGQRLVEPLAVAFGCDERAGAPRALDLEPLQGNADRQRRILADDGRSFARDPDPRLAGAVVGVAAMLPVPSKTVGFSGVRSVRTAIQRIDAAAVVGFEAIDV